MSFRLLYLSAVFVLVGTLVGVLVVLIRILLVLVVVLIAVLVLILIVHFCTSIKFCGKPQVQFVPFFRIYPWL